MARKIEFYLTLLITIAFSAAFAPAQDKRAGKLSENADLPEIRSWLKKTLESQPHVTVLRHERQSYGTGAPKYRATSARYSIDDVDLRGCTFSYSLVGKTGNTLVSMDASTDDPADRQVSGVPVFNFPSVRSTRAVRYEFDLAEIDPQGLLSPVLGDLIIFRTVNGEAGVKVSRSIGGKRGLAAYPSQDSAELPVDEKIVPELQQAFTRAIKLCQGSN